MKKRVVIKEYKSEFPDPLKLIKGAKVIVSDKQTIYPGWVWGETGSGDAGWIPGSYLSISGKNAELIVDYDATELTVNIGEELEILDTEAGWIICRRSNGEVGWVPEENVSAP